jgi:hypothetical protein
MKHTFALTTRQVAKLANSEIPPIYMSVKRYGHWRGITPTKSPSGRLIWRSDQAYSALGLVPTHCDMTNEERFFCQYLEDEALPLTGETWEIIQALLSRKADQGRDPDLYQNESALMVGLMWAFATRLDQMMPIMSWPARKCVMADLNEIARQAASFSDEEANHA